MTGKTPSWLLPATLVGILAGIGLGYFQPELAASTAPLGRLYLNALLLVAALLLPATLISSLAGFGDLLRAAKLAGKAAALLLGTSVVAVLLAAGLAFLLTPGSGAVLPQGSIGLIFAQPYALLSPLFSESLGLHWGNFSLLWLVLLGTVFAVSLSQLRLRERTLLGMAREFQMALLGTAGALFRLAPVGLLFLIGGEAATYGIDRISSMGMLVVAVLAAFALIAFLIVPVVSSLFARQMGWPMLPHLSSPMLAAFGLGSSTAVLPFTFESLTRDAGKDPRATGLTLPLSTIFNVPLQAAYVLLMTLFAAQALQLSWGFDQLLVASLLSILLSIGFPGVPGSSLIITAMILNATGLARDPQQIVQIIAALAIADWLLDRVKAMLTVWLDAHAVLLLGTMEELTTPRRSSREFEGPRPDFKNRDFRRDRFQRGDRRTEESSPFAMSASTTPLLEGGAVPSEKPQSDDRGNGHRGERRFRNDRTERTDRPDRTDRSTGGFRGNERRNRFERRDRTEESGGAREAAADGATTGEEQSSADSLSRTARPYREREMRGGRDRRFRDGNNRDRDRNRSSSRPRHRWSDSPESAETPETASSDDTFTPGDSSFDLSGGNDHSAKNYEQTEPENRMTESHDEAIGSRSPIEERIDRDSFSLASMSDHDEGTLAENDPSSGEHRATEGAAFGRGRRRRGGR